LLQTLRTATVSRFAKYLCKSLITHCMRATRSVWAACSSNSYHSSSIKFLHKKSTTSCMWTRTLLTQLTSARNLGHKDLILSILHQLISQLTLSSKCTVVFQWCKLRLMELSAAQVVTHTLWLISTVMTRWSGQVIALTISPTLQEVHAVRHHYCSKPALQRRKQLLCCNLTALNHLVATILRVMSTKARFQLVKIHKKYSQSTQLTQFNQMLWCITRVEHTVF